MDIATGIERWTSSRPGRVAGFYVQPVLERRILKTCVLSNTFVVGDATIHGSGDSYQAAFDDAWAHAMSRAQALGLSET